MNEDEMIEKLDAGELPSDKDEYIRKEQACGLKVGDTVKITREAEYGERGWANSWTDNMKVGCVGKITAINSDDKGNASGIDVKVKGEPSSHYGYPYFVLEKIEQTYHIGQHFKHTSGDEYLLARVKSGEINMFNLNTGGRWSNQVAVNDMRAITEAEMVALMDSLGQWKDFTLIDDEE